MAEPFTTMPVHIVGAGLAGCEAAWQLVRAGQPVILHEMRPLRRTEAHRSEGLAELVCSNSFRADDAEESAIGLLHAEMRRCGSLILAAADAHAVPAGGALAVDREAFSAEVERRLRAEPALTLVREEITTLPPDGWRHVILATGPLTSPPLAEAIRALTGEENLAFFDALAPIVHADSIDFSIAWRQSRYDKGGPHGDGADYVNCPLDAAQYETFIDGLLTGEKKEFHDWEKKTPYFEGCLPIEVMAARGRDTLRYGPMKPVGLTNPHRPERPHAVVQLRQDNKLATLYNLVGFQTKLTHSAQRQLFCTIPGLEAARFARLGGIHRNSFLNSPRVLQGDLRLKADLRLRFAGQITGVEGYVESAAIGLLAGLFTLAEQRDIPLSPPPPTTALGALLNHLTAGADATSFQPMNANFGLFPPPDLIPGKKEGSRPRRPKGRDRKRAYTSRAKEGLTQWLENGVPTGFFSKGYRS